MRQIANGFIIIVMLLACTCHEDNFHYDLTFRNLSQQSISISINSAYPDTSLNCPFGYLNDIAANCEDKISLSNGWENAFKDVRYFQFFVMDLTINRTYPCDSIRKYNKILKRYQLTLEDMQQMDWKVTYP